jgi:hypothetical protein
MTAVQEWWRPASARPTLTPLAASPASQESGSLAFWALMVFTAILLLSPQIRFSVLVPLRLAFWPAALASAAYVLDRIFGRAAVSRCFKTSTSSPSLSSGS